MNNEITSIVSYLKTIKRVIFLTGAGFSQESGVPTFRGSGGLWRNFQAHDLATPEAFARDPQLVWEWYQWRQRKISECQPNPGHLSLAQSLIEQPEWFCITQNVDGLQSLALKQTSGQSNNLESRLLELHGNIFKMRCTQCSAQSQTQEPIDLSEGLPHCPSCNALLRPDIIWFGEALNLNVISQAFDLAEKAQVCFVIGTSSLVHPAVDLVTTCFQNKGMIIEINPEPTPITSLANWSLRGRSGEILPEILG